MELMTSLQSEQHAVKELSARLAQQEEALAELRQSSSGRFSQSSVSEADVNGHAEIVDALRTQLAAAQDTINTLTNQNAELRAHFVEQSFAGTSPSSDKQVLYCALLFDVTSFDCIQVMRSTVLYYFV